MKRLIVLAMFVVLQSGWLAAQQRGQLGSIQRFLFSPDLVMKHQEELQLTEEQRSSIMQEIQHAQSELTAIQWDLEREMEKLTSLLRAPSLDEEAILAQLEVVLDLERRVKRNQLLLAVRMRNTLDQGQLTTLRRLRVRNAAEQRLQRNRERNQQR